MKPLIVLLAIFVLSLGATKLFTGAVNYSFSGNVAMSAMLLLTASGHFLFANGMASMIPAFIPFKKGMVFITGILEIAAAICLLIPATKYIAAWFLIILFISILPANISAAIRKIDYQKGTHDGPGLSYLWFRVPLQLFFIAWVYFFSIWLNK